MVNCEIKFDNDSSGIYYSGQRLSGVIELDNDKVRNISAISLRIEGFAKCKWTEAEEFGRRNRRTTYSGLEDYIDIFYYLVGTKDAAQTELSAGLHKFNFTCPLPPHLPTSFESKYGFIRYQVKVVIERPWKFDVRFCIPFTVLKPLDLNSESSTLRSPLSTEINKSFFMSSKPLFISAEIPVGGYVSGQTVPVTIRVNNESKVNVEEIKVGLKTYISYFSREPRKMVRDRTELAAESVYPGVPARSKSNIDAQLTIPAISPTNLNSCKVLQVSYGIHILARINGILHKSAILRLAPITIGTIPLTYSLKTNSMTTVAPSPNLQDFPPPSYAAATGKASNEPDSDGEALIEDKLFRPMYPVFNFADSTQIGVQTNEPAYGCTADVYNK